ncbi:MAG: 4-hydroxy-tetrahydrodipicolinate synthase [Candidatus Kapaibacterium sp.]
MTLSKNQHINDMLFTGTATALVTPFLDNGAIDFASLSNLIEHQIAAGVEAVVPCGSTGESATMTNDEKLSVISFTVQTVAGRTRVIAGTGSNDTRATIDLTRAARTAGADAVLLVGPYYNKPTQEGHVRHYAAVADAVDIPMIIYNVPGRTGSNMTAETQLRIAEHSTNIIATKEASANLEQMQEIIRSAPAHFSLLAGDDSLALPAIACGARGVIAVISNYAPVMFGNGVRAALDGRFEDSRNLFYSLLPLMKLNFIESNPVPVKYILSRMGMIKENYRLPLVPLTASSKERIREALDSMSVR